MKRIHVVVLVVFTLLSFGLASSSCSQGGDNGKGQAINFGSNLSGSCALVYIAQERGIFADQGLIVNDTDYNTGAAAIDAVLKGEMNIAWSSEFRLVRGAFAQEKVSAIAVINRFTDQFILGKRDIGINSIADLKGKRIGVPRNTIAEFGLTRFLTLNGISLDDISIVDIIPTEAMGAISSGSVDAVVVWEPYSSQMKTQLAERAVVWSVQNTQPGFGVISGRNDWLSTNPDVVTRFLKSLVQAEDYMVRNEAAARRIVQTKLSYDDASMDTVWSESRFAVSLDESLITAMEDEARWMIQNSLTAEKQVPDFLDYVYEDALEAVKPGAVNIIR